MASRSRTLYDDPRDRLFDRDREPSTPADQLVQAVLAQRADEVQRWLGNGQDPNAPGFPPRRPDAMLPLQAACQVGHPGLVQVLLDAGADPHRVGRTVLPTREGAGRRLYAMNGERRSPSAELDVVNDACATVLQQHGWPTDLEDLDRLLLGAAQRHDPVLVQRWLDAGADVNARASTALLMTGPGGTTGNTALHLALRVEGDSQRVRPGACLAVVQRLIQAGAAIDARNDQGYTPLTQGIRERYSDDAPGVREQALALHALLDVGADATVVGPDGSALVWALESRRHADLVPRLRAGGATLVYPAPTPSAPGTMGRGSALLGALFNGSLAQIRQALELGEDPNRPALTLPNTCSYAGPGTVLPLVRAVQRVNRATREDDFDAVLDLLLAHGLDVLAAVRHPDWGTLTNGLPAPSSNGSGKEDHLRQRVARVVARAQQVEAATLRTVVDTATPDHPRSRSRL